MQRISYKLWYSLEMSSLYKLHSVEANKYWKASILTMLHQNFLAGWEKNVAEVVDISAATTFHCPLCIPPPLFFCSFLNLRDRLMPKNEQALATSSVCYAIAVNGVVMWKALPIFDAPACGSTAHTHCWMKLPLYASQHLQLCAVTLLHVSCHKK